MKLKLLPALLLSLAASNASAVNWPWSEPDVEHVAYCKGLVTAGLSSNLTRGDQRSDLWLAWNHLIRTGGVGHDADTDQFQQGRKVFSGVASAEVADERLQAAYGDCGLGRSGWQITGL